MGQDNILELPLVAKATGNPITAGTVNFYLIDKDGTNADKWYRGSDTSWQVAESIAGVATHRADGHWYLTLPSAVWEEEVRYRLYAKEDGALHIPVGEDVVALLSVADAVWDEVLSKALHNIAQSAAKRMRQLENIHIVHEGTAQGPGAGNNTIVLEATAHAEDNWYKEDWLVLAEGVGAGQMRHIDAYDGTTKVMVLGEDWIVKPDATTDYIIVQRSSSHIHLLEAAALTQIGDAVSDEVMEGTLTLRQTMRLVLATLASVSSGGGTTTITFRDTGDVKDRLTITVDKDGNRSVVVRDVS